MALTRHADGPEAAKEELSAREQRDPVSVLIGFAEALAGPETAWSLLEAGFRVCAFTRRGARPSLRRSKSVQVLEITAPEESADRSAADLRSLLRLTGAQAVMPLDDVSLSLCAGTVPDDVVLVGPRGRQAQLALEKRLQLEAAKEAGLEVPPTEHLDSSKEALSLGYFPLVLKPAFAVMRLNGTLVRGPSFVCGDRRELERAVRLSNPDQPMLAQPLLQGVGEGVFGLVDSDGLRVVSGHRRIRMMNPKGSGSSACKSAPVEDDVAAAAERMLVTAGWRGMFMLEFLREEGGRLWFMEVNGRPWGSMALARRMGFEYPAWALLDALGESWEAPKPLSIAPITCRHLGRELVHLLLVLRGPRSSGFTSWPSRRKTLREVLSFRREDHWYNWRDGALALFLDDTIRTVLGQIASGRRRS